MRVGVIIRGALVAAGLGVVATTATALSTHAPTPYDATLTLAGGDAAGIDPDAPIATARYGDAPRRAAAAPASTLAPSPIDLAGAVAPLAGGPASVPAPKPLLVAQTQPAIQTLAEPRRRPAATAVTVAETRQPALGLVRASARRIPVVKVEDIDIQPFGSLDAPSTSQRLSVNASALMGKMSGVAQDPRRGRWVLFAASSGQALSWNMIRSSVDGWRGSGWSQDRLTRFGTHQVGVGWRKGGKQLSLSATRRKLQAEAYSDRDMVYGVTLSIKPKR
ncbi:hypothetical protein ACN2C6_05200 [Caulobacter sp. ErkDOM-YI]|uniref:hypothetical protein n=1 Tax=unclassified Caulobacter TaxID=2648921 RepID=UPI003AF43B02